MKYLTLIALALLPTLSHADDLLPAERMNLNGALHAIASGNYDQFLKFGTSDLDQRITTDDFKQLHKELTNPIIEGYSTKTIGSQRWYADHVMTHFLMIQFRTPDHEDYYHMLLELKTTPGGRKKEEAVGKIIDLRITNPKE